LKNLFNAYSMTIEKQLYPGKEEKWINDYREKWPLSPVPVKHRGIR
jgi:hypothetical protein